MTDNIILSSGNIEVYQSEIDILCDDYIQSLPDPSMIYKSPVFKGLLLSLYNQKIKHIIETDKQNRQNVYNNYSLLDEIFNNIYIPLVYKYCLVPTIQEFCVFVGISNSNLTDVKNGFYRSNGSKANPESTQTVKKWFEVCESALVSKAYTENSIGAIFGLKAAHGWQEAKQQLEIITTGSQQATPEQIAQKYADIEKPVLIDGENEIV